jgi:hypothetical protein
MHSARLLVLLVVTLATIVARAVPAAAQPPAEAVAAWDAYVERTEQRIRRELGNGQAFLAVETLAPREAPKGSKPTAGEHLLYIVPVATQADPGSQPVPGGLRHHWLAAVFVPGVTVDDVLAFVQDYDRHAGAFPDVIYSRLISRKGDDFEALLRLRRTKAITVYYDTTHAVQYRAHGTGRASSRSIATRIVELEPLDGEQRFRDRPAGDDHGFMWRLNSYWRFLQVDGGVVVECESLSLSRGIPFLVRWIVKPFVTSIPRESLEQTLLGIRKGAIGRAKVAVPKASAAGRG